MGLFIDYTKIFDFMNHQTLFEKLYEMTGSSSRFSEVLFLPIDGKSSAMDEWHIKTKTGVW